MSSKILIVDDEPDLEPLVRQKFRQRIREGNVEFFFSQNGEQALERLRADPDLNVVFADINMPLMDGLTLLGEIGNLGRIIKTVIVSAYDDMQNIRTAMNRGAYDFLTKPINFQDFEITLDRTVRELQTLKQAERDREQLAAIQHELTVATKIQQSILPRTFPPFPDRQEFDIYAEMIPARQVSGDFYDFFLLDGGRIGFVIGDVSGKGIPAAIFMAVSRTLIRATALRERSAVDCLRDVNRILTRQSEGEVFVTIFYGILDLATGEMEYSVGGQNPPYLLTGGGGLARLDEPRGFMIGMFEEAEYEPGHVILQPGDAIFVYTDGVVEAEDREGNLFTYKRLESALGTSKCDSMHCLVNGTIGEVKRFAAGIPQSDDMTVLALRFLRAASHPAPTTR